VALGLPGQALVARANARRAPWSVNPLTSLKIAPSTNGLLSNLAKRTSWGVEGGPIHF
jgi:hypothetical protein